MRASASAWLSGESLGRSAGCCGSAIVLLGGAERLPPKSAAATRSFNGASVVASAAAGATVATAEARAARRANSRRVIPPVLALLALGVSSIKISVCVTRSREPLRAGKQEATERWVERQQRRRMGEGKEARAIQLSTPLLQCGYV